MALTSTGGQDLIDWIEGELATTRIAAARAVERAEALLVLRSEAIAWQSAHPGRVPTIEDVIGGVEARGERERAAFAAACGRAAA